MGKSVILMPMAITRLLGRGGRMKKQHPKKVTNTGAMIIRNVPEPLRREFKSCCATEGKSMQDKVIELISEFTKAQRRTGESREGKS
jgi:hypothetical protein